MGLLSKLFGGDTRLGDCLVRHSAHVKLGDVGPHVGKIQTALYELDALAIDPGEISAQRYGPSTAAAVLKFKRKRRIINASYQKAEDDIVGMMTIDALDKEMHKKELGGGGGGGGAAAKTPLSAVTIWFNFFIPKTISGLTRPHLKLPGVTVVPDDSLPLGIVRMIQTNNRSFDPILSAHLSSLLSSKVSIDWLPATPTVKQDHTTYPVHDVDSVTHASRGSRKLPTGLATFVVDTLNSGIAKFKVQLVVPHPFGTPFDLVGKVELLGTLAIDRAARRIDFDLNADEFPAFEGYAAESGTTASATILSLDVPPGKKPKDLISAPKRSAKGSVTIK